MAKRTILKKTDWIVFASGAAGIALFLLLFPGLFPEAASRPDIRSRDILKTGQAFVKELGVDTEAYQFDLRLKQSGEQLRYLDRAFGPRRAISLADSVPVEYWEMTWSEKRKPDFIFGGGDEDEEDRGREREGEAYLRMDLAGKPIAFRQMPRRGVPADTVRRTEFPGPEVGRKTAAALAEKLIGIYGGIWLEVLPDSSAGQRGPRGFEWELEEKVAGEKEVLSIAAFGDQVRFFERRHEIPEAYVRARSSADWDNASQLLLVLFLFIFVLITLIARLRADLIDAKLALFPALLMLVSFCVIIWFESFSSTGGFHWGLLLVVGISAPFIAGAVWALFAVGESLTRETWAERLIPMDLLRRKILNAELGFAFLRGLFFGCIGLGALAVLYQAAVGGLHASFGSRDTTLLFWSVPWPSLFILSRSLMYCILNSVIFCLFLLSLIKRRFHKPVWIVLVGFFAFSFIRFVFPQLQPFYFNTLISGILGLILAAFFIRYDFLSCATGLLVMPVLFYATAAFHAGSAHTHLQGTMLLVPVAGILITALIGIFNKRPSEESLVYVPTYVQRVYERERIQRELEIARNVQISFLPRKNPEIPHLDVASFCLPAREVGGDYYDFIEFGPQKVGIVIGDVSGKGISAAFYMTLTKGLLKAQARTGESPREVLTQLNELFYENAERGIFISMIYAVFDLRKRNLTFARAGHNPMILRSSKKGNLQELATPGIALGLERGEVFSHSIEERVIGIAKNDLFLFYTDGINEARGKAGEEFGEKRLMDLVETCGHLSAEELLLELKNRISTFTRDMPQHDDMTAVIVKLI